MIIAAVIIGIVSYLIGSVNFSILLSKALSGQDIRNSGSGNAGATNMLRTYGKKMGVITLLLDVLKGIAAVILVQAAVKLPMMSELTDIKTLEYIAGVCVVLGHNFPLYFGFKGGKGVATSLGVVLILDWRIGLIAGVIAIAVMAVTRYVSLGSIIGGAVYIAAAAISMCTSGEFNPIRFICAIVIGGLLIARHHANIKRLLNGTENKLGSKK